MNGIVIRKNESIEKALKRFTKTCERAGVISELKSRRNFEKPSEEKRRKMKAAVRKRKREEYLKEHPPKRRRSKGGKNSGKMPQQKND